MTVLVNGVADKFVSVHDRGLLYGQSVFETIVVVDRKPLLLTPHWQRLLLGCQRLLIPCESELCDLLTEELAQLVSNTSGNAIVRVTVTMGEGSRGYQNPSTAQPTRILSLHDFPASSHQYRRTGIELGLASTRLSSQPALAGIKHGNRLEQILARTQWQDHWQEALLMDQQQRVIEATQSNVFYLKRDRLITPPLDESGVQGVIRDYVLENAAKIALKPNVQSVSLDDIRNADEVFLTNSVIGLWPVRKFEQRIYEKPVKATQLLQLLLDHEVISNH